MPFQKLKKSGDEGGDCLGIEPEEHGVRVIKISVVTIVSAKEFRFSCGTLGFRREKNIKKEKNLSFVAWTEISRRLTQLARRLWQTFSLY